LNYLSLTELCYSALKSLRLRARCVHPQPPKGPGKKPAEPPEALKQQARSDSSAQLKQKKAANPLHVRQSFQLPLVICCTFLVLRRIRALFALVSSTQVKRPKAWTVGTPMSKPRQPLNRVMKWPKCVFLLVFQTLHLSAGVFPT
jgi:hypothetical protein